jgi:hypothetical protein
MKMRLPKAGRVNRPFGELGGVFQSAYCARTGLDARLVWLCPRTHALSFAASQLRLCRPAQRRRIIATLPWWRGQQDQLHRHRQRTALDDYGV